MALMCPYCAGDTRVLHTVGGTIVERWRKCKKCGKTFPTAEAIKFDEYWKQYQKDTYEANKKALEKDDK